MKNEKLILDQIDILSNIRALEVTEDSKDRKSRLEQQAADMLEYIGDTEEAPEKGAVTKSD